MDYAIIKLGNKQHRVRNGETLVVDRLPADEGKSFEPIVLLGEAKVTATVLAHERGPKILVGKYRKRTGYKRHNGFRAATSRVEISLEAGGATPKAATAKTSTRTAKPAAPAAPAPAEVEEAPIVPAAEAPVAQVEDAPPVELVDTPVAEVEEPPVAAADVPEGYEGMTVTQIGAGAKDWSRAELEGALAYEHDHAARKGAIAALTSALAWEDS